MSRIRILLARQGVHSRVWLDEKEISHLLVGFSVQAHVNDLSRVILELSTEVDLSGEAADVIVMPPPTQEPS